MPINDTFVFPKDAVNHPEHYQSEDGIECIDAITSAVADLEGSESFFVGTIIKYLWRYRKKGAPLEDLEKAKWYLDELIDNVRLKEAQHIDI